MIFIKNEVNLSYPRTKYENLNNNVLLKISPVLTEFMNYANDTVGLSFIYSLNISYLEYGYRDYISYVFFTSMDTGGAHPNNTIFTINYDITNNKIVLVDDILNTQEKINKVSSYSREVLLKNKNIQKDKNYLDIFMEGTKPINDNFKNFVFTENGIMIYFEQYKIAPYAAGSFKVLVPYNEII